MHVLSYRFIEDAFALPKEYSFDYIYSQSAPLRQKQVFQIIQKQNQLNRSIALSLLLVTKRNIR